MFDESYCVREADGNDECPCPIDEYVITLTVKVKSLD